MAYKGPVMQMEGTEELVIMLKTKMQEERAVRIGGVFRLGRGHIAGHIMTKN